MPASSFALETMDCVDLQRCASRPSRLIQRIINDELPIPSSLTRLQLTFPVILEGEVRTDHPNQWWEDFNYYELVPGGRWLVGIARNAVDWYAFCWDIRTSEPNLNEAAQPLDPVSFHRLRPVRGAEEMRLNSLEVDHTQDGNDSVLVLIPSCSDTHIDPTGPLSER